MDSSRWERIQEIFHGASDRLPSDWPAYIEGECAGDKALKADVLAMLDEDSRGGSILDRSLPPKPNPSSPNSSAPPADRDFGPYRILRPLGEGGMGTVHLAERQDFGAKVAIKLLRDGLLSPDRRQRFFQEQKMLASLDHPLIARIYDADVLDDGTPWFAMEYVAGQPITNYCRERACSMADRLRLFRSVCEAVQHAHQKTIIHRDLKPSNILVRDDGAVKLLDFGIAKQLEGSQPEEETLTALRPMTLPYASPEQVRGDRVGPQTDVYSLGVLLYELLTGQLPFDFSNRSRIASEQMILECEPELPSAVAVRMSELANNQQHSKVNRVAWAELDVLSLTAMHKDLSRRYRSVGAVIRDVDHYLNGEPLDARPDTVHYRLRKFATRHRRILCSTGGLGLVIVALVTVFVIRLSRERAVALTEAARSQQMERFVVDLIDRTDNPGKPLDLPRALLDAVDPKVRAELYQKLYQKLANASPADQPPPSFPKAKQPLEAQEIRVSGKEPETKKMMPSVTPPDDSPRLRRASETTAAEKDSVFTMMPSADGSGRLIATVQGRLLKESGQQLDLQPVDSAPLRFRLLTNTRFVDQEGKPIRDSQLGPGDQLLVIAKPIDLETAMTVVLLTKPADGERKSEGTPAPPKSVRTPAKKDFPTLTTKGPATTSQPSVLRKIDPQYSEEARQAKVTGTVLLELLVDTDGRAKDIKVTKKLGFGLDEKAIEAVQKWQFTPATKVGRPVAVYATVEVNFQLI
jgi:TonB family protein